MGLMKIIREDEFSDLIRRTRMHRDTFDKPVDERRRLNYGVK